VVSWLQTRGLIHTVGGSPLPASTYSVYAGFDPTASSLHLGNLAVILALDRFKRAGNRVVCLVGGATGLVGDPSGKHRDRELLDLELVRQHTRGITRDLERILGTEQVEIVNNLDWYQNMSAIDFLRDVGKNFRLSSMLAKDSVKSRLESSVGLSFTEFSYQVLQAYDFFILNRDKQVMLQIGGSDQWGNITAGLDLISKHGREACGVTLPLLTTSSGEKFGKSEGNAIWVSAEEKHVYQMYQYLLNVRDEDVKDLLKKLTLLELEEIESVVQQHAQNPDQRIGQQRLAQEVVSYVHSEAVFQKLKDSSSALFSESLDLEKIDVASFIELCQSSGVPLVHLPLDQVLGKSYKEFLPKCNLAGSGKEAVRLINAGGLTVNQKRVSTPAELVSSDHLLQGQLMLLRIGKKKYCLVCIGDRS